MVLLHVHNGELISFAHDLAYAYVTSVKVFSTTSNVRSIYVCEMSHILLTKIRLYVLHQVKPSGEQQEDASECLMMLIELINKGSVPYCDSDDNNSTGVSLSGIFLFMLEKYIVCDACGLRSPSFESSSVLYITSTCTSSMQELIKQRMEQKRENSSFRCKKNNWHVESNHILHHPKYLIIVVNRFRYINNNFTKNRGSIPMNMTVVLGLH